MREDGCERLNGAVKISHLAFRKQRDFDGSKVLVGFCYVFEDHALIRAFHFGAGNGVSMTEV